MRLNSLSILNYKNISEAELNFSPKINCFIGDNGMGKTNLLDAIYFLSFCKSHSNSIDSQNILHDTEFFMLQGKYAVNENEEEIYWNGTKILTNQNRDYQVISSSFFSVFPSLYSSSLLAKES